MGWHPFWRSRSAPRFRPTVEVLEDRLSPSVDVLTYHNDIGRTGLNSAETVLTPANVNSADFGLLFSLPVDGKVDAEPLYMSDLTINGATHNVVFVATEHDSVYAFDTADGSLLWHDAYTGTPTTILPAGEVPSDPVFGNQVTPEIGITDTPVIDPTTNTMYLVAMSKDSSGHYFQRLVALDVATGQLKFGGRTTIAATFGSQTFDPKQYEDRDALLLLNGVVYVSFASHSDLDPYTGWLMGYSASTLAQVSVLDTDPSDPNARGSYWNSGNGWGSDGTNLFNLSANGTFDTTLDANGFPANGDYGNAVVQVSPSGGLHVTDYFTMHNTVAESNADQDLGSGGILVLPDMTDSHGVTQHLALAAGKDGNIYLVNRDNMGKFNPNSDNVYQELLGAFPSAVLSSPAYFNGAVYYGPIGDHLREFTFTNALLNATPAAQTSNTFGYPGTTPSITSNGTSNGIVWAYENASNGSAVLHAYNASNLVELYNSNQAAGGRDQFGIGNKFITPMIADGQVYAATTNSVAVFGLLSSAPSVHFVQSLYTDFLGRSGSQAEWQGWVRGLPTLGRAGVVFGISHSPEALTRAVDEFYVKLLGRQAVGSEDAYWINLLEQGASEEQVAAGILASPEFANRANTLIGGGDANANYVQALYELLLSRTPASSEVAGWEGALPGLGRAGVAAGFLSSPEFRGDFIRELYGPATAPPASVVSAYPDLLDRSTAPSAAEVNGWANSGLDMLRLATDIAASAEYFANG